MITHDPVGDYVAALGRRLRGPWRAKRALLREVSDGLDDATQALVEAGRPRRDAELIAVAEFGPVHELAPEFQRELAVGQVRRTAAWAALTMPALWLAWDLIWVDAPDVGITPPGVIVMSRLTDVIGLGTALLCLTALIVLELAGGRLRAPERLARAVASATLVGVLGVVALSVAMTSLNVQETPAGTESSTGYRLVALLSLLAITVVVRSAIRCARAATLDSAGQVPSHADRVVAVR